MSETFADLIKRLSSLRGLEWVWPNGACETEETAIAAIRKYLEDGAYNRYTLSNARYALEELDKFGRQRWLDHAYDVDWGDVKRLEKPVESIPLNYTYDFLSGVRDQGWHPTEQDYRECCGMWSVFDAAVAKYDLDDLRNFDSREAFDFYVRGWEPMPEQCIPKAEPKKGSYRVKFPLLAGILE